MTDKKAIVGVWCGGVQGTPQLMSPIHGTPLLKLTTKRVGACFCLVPWTRDLDWLEGTLKEWHQSYRRCHTEERVAMRDLVAEFGADYGAIVNGWCGSIDHAEIKLALACLSEGFERYESPRVKAYKAVDWLQVRETEEFGPVLSVEELNRTLPPTDLEARIDELKARARA